MLLLKIVWSLAVVGVATPNLTGKGNITSYDPGEILAKIFSPSTTISSRQRGYGLIFEDQRDTPEDQGLIDNRLKFEDQTYTPVKFQEDQNLKVTFQNNNAIDQGKRRRRRRKPKKGLNHGPDPNYGTGTPAFPGSNYPVNPGFGSNYPVNPGFGPNYANPGFPGPVPYRRRRRPSLASDALTAVTGALTSIALYDDYQCVPRLLCEAAGGGSLGSNGALNAIAGIQPLLTLLSAYNGLSSSPLFVFGRAVFLGMTSQGNTGTCRYAYPQCPTDPEQLIHYLNNHNGGFFRFFNAPLPNQNLEQFYNHLGQNGGYGYQNPGLYGGLSNNGQNGQDYDQNGQIYGQNGQNYDQNGQNHGQNGQYQQGYGLYQNYPTGHGYGFQNNHIGDRPDSYGQNYGSNYDYRTYGANIRFKDVQIEKRIQNKPSKDDFESATDSNWQFPDTQSNFDYTEPTNPHFDYDDRGNDSLKFPEESENNNDVGDSKRKGKSILFPESQYNQNAYSNKNYMQIGYGENTRKPYYQNNYNTVTTVKPYYQNNYNTVTTLKPYYQNNYSNKYNNYISNTNYIGTTETPFNENDYYFDYKHNFYVKKEKQYNNNYNYQDKINKENNNKQYNNNYNYQNNNVNKENRYVNSNGIQTVYIVRGNGDPNRPEIVKVRPGQIVN